MELRNQHKLEEGIVFTPAHSPNELTKMIRVPWSGLGEFKLGKFLCIALFELTPRYPHPFFSPKQVLRPITILEKVFSPLFFDIQSMSNHFLRKKGFPLFLQKRSPLRKRCQFHWGKLSSLGILHFQEGYKVRAFCKIS